MDAEAPLSKIDMQVEAAAFSGWTAEIIYLHVKEEQRKSTDGGVRHWDLNGPALRKIVSPSRRGGWYWEFWY